jgi:hypothetical protein
VLLLSTDAMYKAILKSFPKMVKQCKSQVRGSNKNLSSTVTAAVAGALSDLTTQHAKAAHGGWHAVFWIEIQHVAAHAEGSWPCLLQQQC